MVATISLLLLGQSRVAGSSPELTPTPAPGLFHAYRTANPPQIDGNLLEWPGSGALNLNMNTAFSISGAVSSVAVPAVFP